jgi:hypothetical protein
MSELAEFWFAKATKLEIGQAIYIRCANKQEQAALAAEFEELKDKYYPVDSKVAAQLFVYKKLKERKQYVTIERRYRAPFTGFLQDVDGSFSKVTIDPDRYRIIKLMLVDGYSREEIESTLEGLTEEEVDEFFL